MKLLIIGSEGRIGRRLVAGGTARGHDVTATVDPPGGGDGPEHARVVTCDVLDLANLEGVVRGQNAVIVSLERGALPGPVGIHARVAANVVAAMRGLSGSRLLWLSASGTGEPHDPNLPPYFTRVVRPLLYRRLFEELAAAEATIARSDLDWTIVHLPRLTSGEALGRYRAEAGQSLPGGYRISRRDAADFLLKELELRHWARQRVAIAY